MPILPQSNEDRGMKWEIQKVPIRSLHRGSPLVEALQEEEHKVGTSRIPSLFKNRLS